MVAKKNWENLVHKFVKISNEEKLVKKVDVLGLQFKIFPKVFSPALSADTEWFARELKKFKNIDYFLEIGCGSGVLSCLMAQLGVKKVVATDINKEAVKNTIFNAKETESVISVRLGNIYEPIKKSEKFDIIFWNHPFVHLDKKNKKETPIDTAVFDYGYRSLKEFFSGAKKHLNKSGKIILGTSNIARINLIKKFARENHLKTELFSKKEVSIYKNKKIKMELRLYIFREKSAN